MPYTLLVQSSSHIHYLQIEMVSQDNLHIKLLYLNL